MRSLAISRIIGVFLMLFSLSMLPPLSVALWYQDGGSTAFAVSFFVTVLTGLVFWLIGLRSRLEIRTRDGFIIVVLFWVVLSLFGAIPFMITQHPHISITNAIFESASGLTTTGTNVLIGLDHLPHAIRYYRQQLQFLGGMGIIVLAVAVLPMLGIGGMQLYRAETPGPMKDNKLTPRITQTAKNLWLIYIGLTIACILSYWLAGMHLFDAIGESFSTVATGGFSMHDASFAYFHNNAINLIAVVFMFLSAVNYSLHFHFIYNREISTYWKDSEFRTFVFILFVAAVIVASVLLFEHTYPGFWESIIQAVFTVISMGTTTGLKTADFSKWPTFLPYFIMMVALIGGCAGSTCGGMKVIRILVLQKQGRRELKRLIFPRAIMLLKVNEQVLPEHVIQAIWGFIAVFFGVFVLVMLSLLSSGLDFITAFGATASCLSNVGASIGHVSVNFSEIPTASKWVLIFTMLAGRLEIFTLLVLFMPTFWRA